MSTYLVTPTDRRTPPGRFTANDLIELGEKVAAYLARRHVISLGGFYAQLGDDRGAISQDGRTVTFDIAQES